MHPLLKTPRHIVLLLFTWIMVTGWVATWHKMIYQNKWGKTLWLVVGPMTLALVLCLATWFICKGTYGEKLKLLKSISIHAASLPIMVAIWLMAIYTYMRLLNNQFKTDDWTLSFNDTIPFYVAVGSFLYFIAILVNYLILLWQKKRAAEGKAWENNLSKTQAELNALKATIHPHFLFNCLNAIGPLISQSPEKAKEVTVNLADFLSYSLKSNQEEEILLSEEINQVKKYLEIEKIRLNNRLHVQISISKEVAGGKIPPLTLLTLVENAIKHGICQRLEGGTIVIDIKKENNYLYISVHNPYDPLAAKPKGQGLGLSILQQRLQLVYGPGAKLTREKNDLTFSVRLRYPVKGA